MKSKINFRKVFIFILGVTIFSLLSYLFYILSINFIDLEGDLAYIDRDEVRVLALNNIKNQNLFVNSGDEFKKKLIELNPEIEKIDIKIKNSQTVVIKVVNSKTCCVLIDSNKNKFLIDMDGRVIKKLLRNENYPDEIELNQQIDNNSKFVINTLEKLLEIETILVNKNINVSETILDGKNISFVTTENKKLIIDDELSSKAFVEKLESMLNYLKQNNKDYQKIDFRFGNVIVE